MFKPDASESDASEIDSLWDDPAQHEDDHGDDEFDGDEDHGTGNAAGGQYISISIDLIRPAECQARLVFAEDQIDTLAESIRRYGVIEPIVVRRTADGYELMAGYRRVLAAGQAGLEEVPAFVRGASDAQAEMLGIAENLDRENLSAWEEAQAVGKRRDRQRGRGENVSGVTLAAEFGWSTGKISERLRIYEAITLEVRRTAGVTCANLCGLSGDTLYEVAKADAELRAAMLRNAVHLADGGIHSTVPKPSGRVRSAPAEAFTYKEAANGTETIRINRNYMSSEHQQKAIQCLARLLNELRGHGDSSIEEA